VDEKCLSGDGSLSIDANIRIMTIPMNPAVAATTP
jgi:hypothetical protein